MFLLFLNEFASYRRLKTSSEMYIDVNRGGDKLKINIDIDVPNLPCSLVSLDFEDAMGAHSLNLEGSIIKYNLDKNGNALNSENYTNTKIDDENFIQPDYNKVLNAISNKQGCRLKGYFFVNKVPGNFHISSHAFAPTIQKLAIENKLDIDLNHKINYLSFGDDEEIKIINSKFKEGTLLSLNGKNKPRNKYRTIYEYYIKVVPTTYNDVQENIYYSYQYTYNSNDSPAYNQFPSLYFRYDISPITVEYTHYRDKFLSFFIQICAILGGVFTVTGIIDSMIHKSVKALLRKAQLNKLS